MCATIAFTAGVVAGEGRGRALGSPTMNLDLADVPKELREGVYAVRVSGHSAVMHYGPRPTLKLKKSCEIHILDKQQLTMNEFIDSKNGDRMIGVEVIERLRDVQDFGSEEALKEQIAEDVERAATIHCK